MGILRRVFSFPAMLASLLVALDVLTVRSRFDDPDMWWHLKTGEIIWKRHSIPTADVFSYATHHHSWVPHEWLSQTLIYGAYHLGGYPGLMVWLCFFTAALLIAGYALCSLYSENAKVGWAGALILWFFSTSGLAIRPQMIGYLLLVVELLVLHLGVTRNARWFFWLPPLFAVWVNCHGSFFFGLVVAAVVLFCSFFEFQLGSLVSFRWESRPQRFLIFALLLSMVALFLNPVGWKQILYPLNAIFQQPINISQVQEWRPLQMSSARGIGLMGVLGSIFLLVLIRRSKLLWHELVLLALGTWFAVSHQRMTFVFGILAAPVLSRLLAPLWEGYDPAQDLPLPNAIIIMLSILAAFWAFPSEKNIANQVDNKSPVKAVEFIKSSHMSGNMLNDYGDGGYLIWAAPEHPVFVDGRGDVYEWVGVLRQFGEWATLETNPNNLLDKYHIDFCLLARQSPMAQVMPLLPGWEQIYSDDLSIIFRRRAVKEVLNDHPTHTWKG